MVVVVDDLGTVVVVTDRQCGLLVSHVISPPRAALTALAMKGDEERIRAAGCDGYIAKPLRYQAFLATIAGYLKPT